MVKQGERGATVARPTAPRVTVPAPAVEVVAPVGAGDAFAAGFLSATLRGLPLRDRVRHGHLGAAAALTVPGDTGTPPGPAGGRRTGRAGRRGVGRAATSPPVEPGRPPRVRGTG